MPLYDFTCNECGQPQEHFVKYEARDESIPHEGCGGQFIREGVSAFKLGSEPYQMGVQLSDGSTVRGHFGKEAKRRRKK